MKEEILKRVQDNAAFQSSYECWNNYLTSCENHGGDVAEAAKKVRTDNPPCWLSQKNLDFYIKNV